jgi:hypothetical protein
MLLALLLTSCGGDRQDAGQTSRTETRQDKSTPDTTVQTPSTTVSRAESTRESSTREDSGRRREQTDPEYGYTYGQASGNRIVDGIGNLPDSSPVDVQLDGVPTWVAGVPLGDGTAWVATLEDGRVQAFRLNSAGETESMAISPNRLAPGQPPLVVARGDSLKLVTSRYEAASRLTHPVPLSLDGGQEQLGIKAGGQVFEEVNESGSVGVGETGIAALPDARFVRGDGGTLAFLSSPTTRYDHGVLGDAIEADAMTLLRPGEQEKLEAGFITPASGGVFEQVSPLWFEVPGSDGELLAVTESTPELATRVSVYCLDGSLVAAGPFIGEPYKWRHLIAAGPFGPNGEIELVDTLTPHIGGTLEFYRPDLDNGSLNIAATQTGYTSHRIYTRNMDTARAGDLDGDGRWELLVPNDAYTELGAVRRTQDGSEVAWTLPAGGVIVTNLASATNSEGRAQVAVGRADGVLRIWP